MGLGYRPLASRLEEYLAADARAAGKDYNCFADMYLHRMATELAEAISAGQKLRLGLTSDPEGQWEEPTSYNAVFVWSGRRGGAPNPPAPAYVFTSSRQGDPGSQTYDANDLDRHVSLEVDIKQPRGSGGVPQLRIQTWRFGMCFFSGCPRIRVLFPWPRALEAVP